MIINYLLKKQKQKQSAIKIKMFKLFFGCNFEFEFLVKYLGFFLEI